MPVPNTPNYYAVADPMFQRAMRNIFAITRAQNAVVTTTLDGLVPGDHNYETGLIVRLYIPDYFGMVQANHLQGSITVLSSSTFSITIDTTTFDQFVIPTLRPGYNGTPAVVVPIGEITEILTGATQNVLP